MNVEFLETFSKDVDDISRTSIKKRIYDLIMKAEAADGLLDIPNTKKLKGHKSAYRIRIGDYRIGVFADKDTVTFARVVNRKDIYRVFP